MLLFAGMGAALAETLWLLPPASRALAAVGGAVTGPLACAIERGRVRPFSWAGCLALAALAAAVEVTLAAALEPRPGGAAMALRGLSTLGLGALLCRLGARLDRGETGWRAAVREGPPDGGTPLAWGIAARRLPRPLGLLLLPAELPLRALLLLAIRLYQLTFSRLMPPACRFEPTCSRYGYEAICRHGAVRGSLLTGVRLVRCSPISQGGFDPVPARARPDARLPETGARPPEPDAGAPACPNGGVSSAVAERPEVAG